MYKFRWSLVLYPFSSTRYLYIEQYLCPSFNKFKQFSIKVCVPPSFLERTVARLPRPLWRAFNSASQHPLHMIIRTVLSYSTVLITTHKSRRPTISAVVHITAMYIYMHMYLNLPLLLHRIDNHKISLICQKHVYVHCSTLMAQEDLNS